MTHLTEDQQLPGSCVAADSGNDGGRNDGNETGDRPPQPGLKADLNHALHDHL